MPRIQIIDPSGLAYQIATRATETMLRAWFDEILPWCHDDEFWPQISIYPMWAWKMGPPSDPDWLCDGRVMGGLYEFRATDGETGLKALLELRRKLERELELADRHRSPAA